MNCEIHLFTGEGEGKTLAALGLALRSIGHGKKVVIVQFMKGRKYIGEYKIKSLLKGYYEIYQFGRENFVNLEKPSKEDKKLANEGLEFVKNIIAKNDFDVLILDEINLAASIGLLDVNDVLELLKTVPKDKLVVMTGRRAPKEFIEVAELVTEMKDVKHPYRKGILAREGIEY